MDEPERIEDYEERVRKELRERMTDEWEDEPHDTIHEIADSGCPVYNHDILELAANDAGLAMDEPSIGPAFDGSATPINIIAANIYERLTEACWDEWRMMETEREEAEAEAETK